MRTNPKRRDPSQAKRAKHLLCRSSPPKEYRPKKATKPMCDLTLLIVNKGKTIMLQLRIPDVLLQLKRTGQNTRLKGFPLSGHCWSNSTKPALKRSFGEEGGFQNIAPPPPPRKKRATGHYHAWVSGYATIGS